MKDSCLLARDILDYAGSLVRVRFLQSDQLQIDFSNYCCKLTCSRV
jgi:hypothetical protein